jgi:hypothetical protein
LEEPHRPTSTRASVTMIFRATEGMSGGHRSGGVHEVPCPLKNKEGDVSTFRCVSIRRAAASGAVVCIGLGLSVAGCADANLGPGNGEYVGEQITLSPADLSDSVLPPQGESDEVQASCPTRSDLAPLSPNPVMGEGPWGTWEPCFHYCPEGTFAYGLALKSEPSLGSGGDDTALNGVRLRCWSTTHYNVQATVAAAESPWGYYMANADCPLWGQPLAGGRMRIEASVGSGDDTSANELQGWCHDPREPRGPLISPPTYTHWGSMGTLRSCPLGSVVCGVRTKLEGSVGSGDDTALNGIQFSCCTFNPWWDI